MHLAFSPPVPATKASILEHQPVVAPDEVYFNDGMPPVHSFRPLAPQLPASGTATISGLQRKWNNWYIRARCTPTPGDVR